LWEECITPTVLQTAENPARKDEDHKRNPQLFELKAKDAAGRFPGLNDAR
jgi:hypothetical protein